MYKSIIFLQSEDDFEPFSGTGGEGISGFFDSEDEEQLDYLMQWYDPAHNAEELSRDRYGVKGTLSSKRN